MRRFEYYEPQTLDEAVALLGQYSGKVNILAGGTDILVEIKENIRRPDHLVNIKKIPGLDHLTYSESEGLKIGSLATVREVEINPIVREKFKGLAQAAAELGSIQVRNRATIAGNICRASPSADTLPPLIADGAAVCLYGPQGERTILMEDFFTGPGQTVMHVDELLVEIIVPAPLPGTVKAYIKHGRRKAMELATVGVAVNLRMDGRTCREAKIVLGAVAPTPIRARKAEALLREAQLDRPLVEAAAVAAMDASRPISDVRSSAAYRREMVRVLTKRALIMAGGLLIDD